MHNFAILYVEDEEYDVYFLKLALARVEIPNPLIVVVNGREAMAYLDGRGPFAQREQYPVPGLVLLDLNLPYQSGFEVLKWMREQPLLKSIPVLVYTSSDQPQDIQTAYDLGANGYLLKTSDPDELCAMLKAVRDYWLIYNLPARCDIPENSSPGI